MRIQYEIGGEQRDFELQSGPNGLPKMMWPEVADIQAKTGLAPAQFWEAMGRFDVQAVGALVIVLEKRLGNTLRFDDLDKFDVSTFVPSDDPEPAGPEPAEPAVAPKEDAAGSAGRG